MADTTNLRVNLFDGTRRPFQADVDVLIHVFNSDIPNKEVGTTFEKGQSFLFADLPFANSPVDDFRVIAAADHHYDAGFFPLRMPKNDTRELNLMLIPKSHRFVFNQSAWDQLPVSRPELFAFLRAGVEDDAPDRERYERLMNQDPETLAALLNITTAIGEIRLPRDSETTALSYFRELIWDPASLEAPKKDRF